MNGEILPGLENVNLKKFFDKIDQKTLDLLGKIGVENKSLSLFLTSPLAFFGELLPATKKGQGVTECIESGQNIGVCLSEAGKRIREKLNWEMPSGDIPSILKDIQQHLFRDPTNAVWDGTRLFWEAANVFLACLPQIVFGVLVLAAIRGTYKFFHDDDDD